MVGPLIICGRFGDAFASVLALSALAYMTFVALLPALG
jgi:hypothetical protein